MVGRKTPGSFRKRFLSALVAGPPALFIVWYGGLLYLILLVTAFMLALRELFRLAGHKKDKIAQAYMAGGTVYILISFLAFYILGLPEWDKAAFVVLVLVFASDIGGYVFGKIIGGTKMLESVSPNKTWAGLGGAIIGPAMLALLFVYTGFHMQTYGFAVLAGIVIGLCGQAGDLIVSKVKRTVGVKDTGGLLPGHGGLLDRIDSLLLCGPAYIVLSMAYGHV